MGLCADLIMENICKPGTDTQLKKIVETQEQLVGQVKQLVEALTAENKELKERLAKYEPDSF